MASVASQLIEEVAAHAQSDSLEDAREICADGTRFLNNLHAWPLRMFFARFLNEVFSVGVCIVADLTLNFVIC